MEADKSPRAGDTQVCFGGVCFRVPPGNNLAQNGNLSGRTVVAFVAAAVGVYLVGTLIKGAVGQEMWTKTDCFNDDNGKKHCSEMVCHYEEKCDDLLAWLGCRFVELCVPKK